MKHTTVLKNKAVEYLSIQNNGIYIDATFGFGGHSRQILSKCENITLFCIDRDDSVLQYFNKLKDDFQKARLHFINAKFSDGLNIVFEKIGKNIDGILFDFGLSSMQIDNSSRGFSFQNDAKLSMEMGLNKISADEIINTFAEQEIADLIYKYGGERQSRRIAKAIILTREAKPIESTLELANIIKKAVGRYNDTINPATRTFQAIRIYVNDEIEEIEKVVEIIPKISKIGTRVVCISFHSLEDEIIKRFIRKYDIDANHNNYDRNYGEISSINENNNSEFKLKKLHKGVIIPSDDEISQNPRSRSAKMRGIDVVCLDWLL